MVSEFCYTWTFAYISINYRIINNYNTYKTINNYKERVHKIKKKIAGLDLELEIRKDGFISKKLGFSVWRKIYNNSYLNKVESIFVFSKEYDIDEEIDLDELYESIMSKDYDPDTEVEKWN